MTQDVHEAIEVGRSPNGTSKANGVHLAVKVDIEDNLPAPLEGTNLPSDAAPVPNKSKFAREWNVKPNAAHFQFNNPIRKLTDAVAAEITNRPNFISLAQGDPATFGPHMKVPDVATSSLINVIQEGKNNGYSPSMGLPEVRRDLAEYLSKGGPYTITAVDVFLTSGASQALHFTLGTFAYPGRNVLLPRPGFPVYDALCKLHGAEIRHYDLLDNEDADVDLDQLPTLIDDNTAVMVLCNPGNPSGGVFSRKHLSRIAAVAGELKVPIISDEVYAGLTFGKTPFVSMAEFSSIVPVLAIGGVSKNWLAPGWRLGWISVWDPHGILRESRILQALINLMQVSSGTATPMQAALPRMLKETPASFYEKTRASLRDSSSLCFRRCNALEGLDAPTKPAGAMFMMVRIDLEAFKDIDSCMEFSSKLFEEESVLVLPGVAFGRAGWFRVAFGLPSAKLDEAWDRIEKFCLRHAA